MASKKFKYIGPFEAVELPTLGLVVKSGETFEAPEGVVLGDDFQPKKES